MRAFGEAAERLGVELAFATDRCHQLEDPWRDSAVPVRFYDDRASLDAIARAAAARPIDGLLAVGDRPTVLAALAAERLGLAGNPPDAARASANKRLMRERLSAAGLPAPRFQCVRASSDARALAGRIEYPCVVKPLAMAASRGVTRANDDDELVAAFERLRRLLGRKEVKAERDPAHDWILVEDYIPGRELALEGVLERGDLRTLAIFDKPEPLEGPYFEETIYVTPPALTADDQATVAHTIGAGARALGLRHGPVHAECRVNDRGVYILEIAARPIGGLCARALRFVNTGDSHLFARNSGEKVTVPLEELLLLHALGEPIGAYAREARASAVMMIPIPRKGLYKGVDGLEEARAIEGIDAVEITAKADQLLLPLPEGSSYLGFIFAKAGRPEEATAALREALARLTFRIDSSIAVVDTRN